MSISTEYENLYEWFEKNGGQMHPDIRIDKNQERGLFVRSNIPIYTLLISVPFSMIITAKRSESNVENEKDHDVLIRFLLNEYSKGETSFWYSWYKLFNIDEEKSNFLTRQMQLYDSVEHSTIAQALTARYQQLQEDYSESINEEQCDFDLYSTIDHLVWSRALELPDSIGFSLVPMIDFANHRYS